MCINNLKNININKLIKLGYLSSEANWITNLSTLIVTNHTKMIEHISNHNNKYNLIENANICVDNDGHTLGTNLYTKAIVSSIILEKDWCRNNVHLNYPIISNAFFSKGFTKMGIDLLMYNFSCLSDNKILMEFSHRYSNKNKIEPMDLLPLLKITEKNNK